MQKKNQKHKDDNLHYVKLLPKVNASALKRRLGCYENLYLIDAQHHNF